MNTIDQVTEIIKHLQAAADANDVLIDAGTDIMSETDLDNLLRAIRHLTNKVRKLRAQAAS